MAFTITQADAAMLPLADESVDLVMGSPPYCDARTYGIGAERDCQAWIDWMLVVTAEALRVSRGAVIWVAAGVTRDRTYWPACEGLMYEWWKRGGSLYRPCYWHRVGIPGSGGDQWFRADVEYVMCFKRPGKLPWTDNTAMGHAPKWAPGGEMAYRLSDGTRINQWGKPGSKTGTTATGNKEKATIGKPRPSHVSEQKKDWGRGGKLPETRNGDAVRRTPVCGGGSRRPNGDYKKGGYDMPAVANPGTLIRTNNGGGQIGDRIAHENEAPYPEKLCEWFILSLCPPGGTVYDPFAGSGTTPKVAETHNRRGLASDVRMSECRKTERRLRCVEPMLTFAAGAACQPPASG